VGDEQGDHRAKHRREDREHRGDEAAADDHDLVLESVDAVALMADVRGVPLTRSFRSSIRASVQRDASRSEA
jgi:hypothetical protein